MGLGILVLEVQELQDERVFDRLLRRHGILGLGDFSFFEHRGFVLGDRRAFVELAADLAIRFNSTLTDATGFPVCLQVLYMATQSSMPS